MLVTVFDLETTGLLEDPNAKVIECAYIIYDTETKRDVKSKSYLVRSIAHEEKISPEIEQLTGLSTDLVKGYGFSIDTFCKDFTQAMFIADNIVMARNGENFDVPMLERMYKLAKQEFKRPICIDDTVDIIYPKHVKGSSLSYISADHGFINYRPHSALSDVQALIGIMEKGGYNWDEALVSAKTKIITVQALVDFATNQKAKDAGFRWEPKQKIWYKRVREYHFDEKSYDFKIKIM